MVVLFLAKWTAKTGLHGHAGNLFMSTYLHSAAIRLGSPGDNRPLVMPRYAGLGQQRYCCGFSGDTDSQWTTLQAEVNMTKTAANIGFGWWSHDIGGFKGDPGPELYARWAQFGAVSPIYRSHGHVGDSPRRPWLFSTFKQIREAMLFRAVLAPLIYTLAREAYVTGVAVARSMYVEEPGCPAAYGAPGGDTTFQYFFGRDMLVRPVVEPMLLPNQSVSVVMWLPGAANAGWVDWQTSAMHAAPNGGRYLTVAADIDTLPMFVRAGAILPLLPVGTLDVNRDDAIVWAVFPGAAAGSGTRYIDDGVTTNYEAGTEGQAYGYQNFSYTWSAGEAGAAKSLRCTIGGVGWHRVASAPLLYTVELRGQGAEPPASVLFGDSEGSIAVVGAEDGSLPRPAGTVVLSAPSPLPRTQPVVVQVKW